MSSITWLESKRFCQILEKILLEKGEIDNRFYIDLPTEAQWEYACRAGTQTLWHFGDDASQLNNYAWYLSNSGDTVHPVEQKQANPWGIHDLYGNVEEWCSDSGRRYTESSQIDPIGNTGSVEQTRVRKVRGGDYGRPVRRCRSGSSVLIDIDNYYRREVGIRIILQARKNSNGTITKTAN